MSSPTALIVDDTPANIVLLEQYLALNHVTCISATSGKEGFQLAREYQPDIIFMDLRMPTPTWDGLETTRHLKANPITAHIPVIAVTAAGTRDESCKAGCEDYLQRPFLANQLRSMLNQYL